MLALLQLLLLLLVQLARSPRFVALLACALAAEKRIAPPPALPLVYTQIQPHSLYRLPPHAPHRAGSPPLVFDAVAASRTRPSARPAADWPSIELADALGAARELHRACYLGMYSMHPIQAMSNGGIGNGIMDPSGTINPAALNSAGMDRAFLCFQRGPVGAQNHQQSSQDDTLAPAYVTSAAASR